MSPTESANVDQQIGRLSAIVEEMERSRAHQICTELMGSLKTVKAMLQELQRIRADALDLVTEAHKP